MDQAFRLTDMMDFPQVSSDKIGESCAASYCHRVLLSSCIRWGYNSGRDLRCVCKSLQPYICFHPTTIIHINYLCFSIVQQLYMQLNLNMGQVLQM